MINFQTFLEIENDSAIMSFTSPCGQPLWPLVRNSFYVLLTEGIEPDLPAQPVHKHLASKNSLVTLAKLLSKLPESLSTFKHRIPLVYHTGSFDLVDYKQTLIERGCEPLVRYFTNDSMILCRENHDRFPTNIPFCKKDMDPLLRLSSFASKCIPDRVAAPQVTLLVDYIAHKFKQTTQQDLPQNIKASLQSCTLYFSKRSCIFYPLYKRLWRAIKPKIVFYLVGMYGTDSESIRAAHEEGIVTAELQHGLVYKNHYAYSFHPNLLDNPSFKNCYPQWMITHGSWFEDKINVPSQVYTLGWPYVTLQKNSHLSVQKDSLVFAPTGTRFSTFLSIAQEVSQKKPDIKIIIRPHPMDIEDARQAAMGSLPSNLTVDLTPAPFSALARATAVVGDMSTMLFTAIPFQIPIYSIYDQMIDTYLSDDNPFIRFKNADDLIHLLAKTSKEKSSLCNEIYPNNWDERFISFLTTAIGKENVAKLTPTPSPFFS